MSVADEQPNRRLESAPPHLRPLLSAGGKTKELRVGDSITSATGYDSTVLCVLSGAVQVTAPSDDLDEMALETIETGEVFGDLAFLTGRSPAPRAQLVAVKPSVILEISVDNFQRVLRENPDFTSALLRALAKRVEGVGRSVFVCRFRPGVTSEDSHLSGMLLSGDHEAGMILSAFVGGRIWCSVCAIGALSKLAKKITAREIPFPNRLKLRSDFLIAGGVLFIIWMETAVDIRSHPYILGLLLLSMFVLAFILNTLYARQAWCRYLCPLGGMTGLLARISIVELRADTGVCLARCASHDCYYGTADVEGCPFGQVAATLHSNHYCKTCGNCVKTCRHDAIRLQFRPPGRELWETTHVRTGTGFLVLGLLGGLLSDMAVRTPHYSVMLDHVHLPHVVLFSGLFFITIAGVNLPVLGAAALSKRALQETLTGAYARFSLGLLPLVCSGFLAFHLYYLVDLGVQTLRSATATGTPGGIAALIPDNHTSAVLVIQQALVLIGLGWTAFTDFRIAGQAPCAKKALFIGAIPHILAASALAALLIAMLRLTFSGGT